MRSPELLPGPSGSAAEACPGEPARDGANGHGAAEVKRGQSRKHHGQPEDGRDAFRAETADHSPERREAADASDGALARVGIEALVDHGPEAADQHTTERGVVEVQDDCHRTGGGLEKPPLRCEQESAQREDGRDDP